MLTEAEEQARQPQRHRQKLDFELDVFGTQTPLGFTFADGPAKLGDLVPLARSLCRKLTEATICNAQSLGELVTCRKGCAHCCRYLVPVSAAEALHIKGEIDAMPAARRRAAVDASLSAARCILNNKIPKFNPDEHTDQQASRSNLENISNWYAGLNLDCPFLASNVCSIYEQRPLVCREHMVASPASVCKVSSPRDAKVIRLPASPAEALSHVSGKLLGNTACDVILPLIMVWSGSNAGRQTWPAKVLVEHFIEALQQNAEQKSLLPAATV